MVSWRAAAGACAQATRAMRRTQESQLARGANQVTQRGFAAGGHGHGEGVTHAGLTLHKPTGWQPPVGKAFASLMWFWVFYRFYHDYEHFLFGPAAHLEHSLHEEEHGGQGHSSEEHH